LTQSLFEGFAQSLAARHCTQRPRAVSQVLPLSELAHSAFVLQPVEAATQVPVLSHVGLLLSEQSASFQHDAQRFNVMLHTSFKSLHVRSDSQLTFGIVVEPPPAAPACGVVDTLDAPAAAFVVAPPAPTAVSPPIADVSPPTSLVAPPLAGAAPPLAEVSPPELAGLDVVLAVVEPPLPVTVFPPLASVVDPPPTFTEEVPPDALAGVFLGGSSPQPPSTMDMLAAPTIIKEVILCDLRSEVIVSAPDAVPACSGSRWRALYDKGPVRQPGVLRRFEAIPHSTGCPRPNSFFVESAKPSAAYHPRKQPQAEHCTLAVNGMIRRDGSTQSPR
jgi:hypothetical protein